MTFTLPLIIARPPPRRLRRRYRQLPYPSAPSRSLSASRRGLDVTSLATLSRPAGDIVARGLEFLDVEENGLAFALQPDVEHVCDSAVAFLAARDQGVAAELGLDHAQHRVIGV